MKFYTSIAPLYDTIFPRNEELELLVRTAFLSTLSYSRSAAFLDIGCGTGTLLLSLAPFFAISHGLDLDSGLLQLAQSKAAIVSAERKIQFHENSMLDIGMLFPEFSIQCAACTGNTIPHLLSVIEIRQFLTGLRRILDPDGVFVFQMINYDRILDNGIRHLPVIRAGSVIFERFYSEPDSQGLLDFHTILTDSASNSVIENTVKLNPIRKQLIEKQLRSVGFTGCTFYDADGTSPWNPDSFLLTGVCS